MPVSLNLAHSDTILESFRRADNQGGVTFHDSVCHPL
jgi:hypothetical protein